MADARDDLVPATPADLVVLDALWSGVVNDWENEERHAKALERIVDNVAPYLNVVLLLTLMATIGGTTLATILVARHLHHWAEVVSTVGMTLLLGLIYTLKVFDIIWIMTRGGPGMSSTTLATWSYQLGFASTLPDFSPAAAVGPC